MSSEPRSVALVTGAASGIGRALATALGARGHRVLLADRDEGRVRDTAGALAANGADAHSCTVDIADPRALDAVVDRARALGDLRYACLNAGVTTTGTTAWETPDEAIDLMLDVNLRGLFSSLRATVPEIMRHGRPASILITASMAGLVASPTSAAYAASKAGVVAVAKALRDELAAVAPHLTVTVLCPGMVKTNLMVTSAAQHAPAVGMPSDLVEGAHETLNTFGLEPGQVAEMAIAAMEAGTFWALPPQSDPFLEILRAEVEDLAAHL